MTVLWTHEDASGAVEGNVTGPFAATGVSIDSRSLEKGDLFIALRGENRDGHMYVEAAAAAGAAAALVESTWPGIAQSPIPLIIVDDAYKALYALAAAARARTKAKIAAVTGSVGKTGAKEGLALALSAFGTVHRSEGNFNNHYGAPLSLARLPEESDFAVFELGMDHAGEIEPLSRLMRPHIALITTVSAVHIEYFESTLGIADAKAEIFAGLVPDGVAILPRDNALYHHLRLRADEAGVSSQLTFGQHSESDFRVRSTTASESGQHVRVLNGTDLHAYRLSAIGIHRATASAAVLACVHALGQNVIEAAQKLVDLKPGRGRGAILSGHSKNGPITIIDESYNASPIAVKAAISVLSEFETEGEGRKIFVLGDMLELGDYAREAHAALSNDVRNSAIDLVYTCGPLSAGLHTHLPEEKRGAHARDSKELGPIIARELRRGDVVTIKGSLGSKMKPIVDMLLEAANTQTHQAEG